MSDDPLLRHLGKLAREQARQQPPAELLTPSLTAETRATARALAALGIDSPAAPLDGRNARSTEGLSLGARLRQRWAWIFMVPAAAAAVVAAVLVWHGPGEGAALPVYALEASGGISETRAAERPAAETPLLLDEGTPIELHLRPATGITGDVAVRLYWMRDDRVQIWNVVAEQAPGGAMRVVAPAERPFGVGAGVVVAVVARPDRLPITTPSAAELRAGRPGWQTLRWPVLWRAPSTR